MIISISGRKWLAISFIILFSDSFNAQIREPFSELDLTDVTSDFLYPQTRRQDVVPNPSSWNDTITPSQGADLFNAFDLACLNPEEYFGEFASFYSNMHATAKALNCRPMAVLDISYHDFIPNAADLNLVYFDQGKFHDVEGSLMSPFVQNETLVLWIDASLNTAETMRFILKQDWYITNKGVMPETIQMDFDDGMGFRLVDFDEIIEVQYAATDNIRTVRCKVERPETPLLHAAVKLEKRTGFDPCASSTFPYPEAPPWPHNENEPWNISAMFGEQVIRGNAYTLESEDGVFDKPFIFVEGIDFGLDDDGYPIHQYYRHGNFGWCEFTSGFVDPNSNDDLYYAYDDLHLMPEILDELRTYGYDIILLDFEDGAADIDKNAELLIHLIELTREYRVGAESIVLAGASMGGLVSRFALRKMELADLDHCVRLWISFDSPHAGANIPAAMQQAIKFLADNGLPSAINFRDQYLMRPAARQLLNYQAFGNMTMHNNWFGLLNQLGWPERCRDVAISNGRADGVGLYYNYPRMMDWQCDLGVSVPAKYYLYHNAGDPLNDANIYGQYLIGDFRTTVTGIEQIGDEWFTWFGSLALPLLDYVDVESRKVLVPEGGYNWDYSPGGTRASIVTMADAINDGLVDFGIAAVCNEVDESEYNAEHSFVPTVSAFGINSDNPYIDVTAYWNDNPESLFFDNVYFPTDRNERHVEITNHNRDFILAEVLGAEYAGLGSTLSASSSNNGYFNYGKPGFTVLRNLTVDEGGHLAVNAAVNTHFNTALDYTPESGNFKLETLDCTPAIVTVESGGLIEIGDAGNPDYTAEVHIKRDSKLIVLNGGTLVINPGSILVIEEGAELIVYPGSILDVYSGNIVIKAGAVMHVVNTGSQGGEFGIGLHQESSRLTFDGGVLSLDNTTFTNANNGSETGYIEVLPGTENMLHTSGNAIFRLNGLNEDDLLLKINNYAHLQNANFHVGKIDLNNCLVDLSNHGGIYTDMLFTSDQVKYVSGDDNTAAGGEIWVWYNGAQINRCQFQAVKLHGHHTKMLVKLSAFNDHLSGIELMEGGYQISHSTFSNSTVRSEALQNASRVEHCNFEGGINALLFDKSLVEIFVSNSIFNNAPVFGIDKTGGRLRVSCSDFIAVRGVRIADGELDMSSYHQAGYNAFVSSEPCITVDNASGIFLEAGYNDFSGYTWHCVEGTINLPCGGDFPCDHIIEANGNNWGSSDDILINPDELLAVGPSEEIFDVHTSVVVPCAGYENTNACNIVFSDNEPVIIDKCPLQPLLVVKNMIYEGVIPETQISADAIGQLKTGEEQFEEPVVSSGYFNQVPLDSALTQAASFLESYDSLGSDQQAIDYFHDILTSGLDMTNGLVRSRMNWGRRLMKTAVEHLFLTGDLNEESNETIFETPVQQYVDVLNLMTDTMLTDSTYRTQFYLELDKGQLFRTIGNLFIAREIFVQLGECQLDSLEQHLLNDWREQVEAELVMQQLFVDAGLEPTPDSIEVDTTVFISPVNMQTSNYYFGLWIDSPLSVTFVSCGPDPVYRMATGNLASFELFPNPGNGAFTIRGKCESENVEVNILDMTGKLLLTFYTASMNNTFAIQSELAPGPYIIRIVTPGLIEDHLYIESE